MQLVLVAHRCGAAFEVRYVAVVIGNDERALELSCVGCVDAEVGRQLAWATHTLGDVHKGAVAEHCGVECCKEIVAVVDYRAKILAHQLGMLLYGLAH